LDVVAGADGEYAAGRLAALLEEQGRGDEAVEAMRPFAADGSPNAAAKLAELLTRHGRVDEAIETLRPVPRSMGGDPEWIIRMLWTLLLDEGRVEEALAVIDDLAAHAGGMWSDLFFERTWLLAACGRIEQAIAELRAHPEADTWYVAGHLADLLADAGRLDEAVAVLWPPDRFPQNATGLAKLLVRQGRVKDAVTVLHDRPRRGVDTVVDGQPTPPF
jgi:thioredoxin-like negative regulator of GroEL